MIPSRPGHRPSLDSVLEFLQSIDQRLSAIEERLGLSAESQALLEEGLADGRAGRVSELKLAPVCAWNDLGGCGGEQIQVTFKDGVSRHLCKNHHELWPNAPKSSSALDTGDKTCAGCGQAIPKWSSHYAGVPGRGDLCMACHGVAFPPSPAKE